MIPQKPDAYRLLHEGAIALANVEENGFRINPQFLEAAINETQQTIRDLETELFQDPVYAEFVKAYGDKTNIDSGPQMEHIFYDVLGYEAKAFTRHGKRKTDKTALEDIPIPFVDINGRRRRLMKLEGTNLQGLRKAISPSGLIHADFDLNMATTFRGNCHDPNLQNIPVRDEEQMRIVRSCFVPHDSKSLLLEADLSGAEVRTGACYHQDPMMIKQILSNFDPHRTLAAKIFKCKLSEISKATRNTVKGDFTFAQQYGAYYIPCAQRIWDQIRRQKLKTESGTPLYAALEAQGVSELGLGDPDLEPRSGSLERRVWEVERLYWDDWYPIYGQWRKDWHRKFVQQGYIDTLTGFRIVWSPAGLCSRNEIINAPIQGSSFHCLLRWLIHMVKWLRKYKMKSKIVCTIHDSIIFSARKNELKYVMEECAWFIRERLPQLWSWLIVPLELEFEGSDECWAKKEKIEL